MKWFFLLVLLASNFCNASAQADYSRLLDSMATNTHTWSAEKFKELQSKMEIGKSYHGINALSSLDIDSAFLFQVDSSKIYGTLTKGGNTQMVYNAAISVDFFFFLKK